MCFVSTSLNLSVMIYCPSILDSEDFSCTDLEGGSPGSGTPPTLENLNFLNFHSLDIMENLSGSAHCPLSFWWYSRCKGVCCRYSCIYNWNKIKLISSLLWFWKTLPKWYVHFKNFTNIIAFNLRLHSYCLVYEMLQYIMFHVIRCHVHILFAYLKKKKDESNNFFFYLLLML